MVLGSLVILYVVFLQSPLAKFNWGGCPSLPKAQNFDLNRYLGDWYEAARDASTPFEKGECSQAHYELNESGTVKVVNSEYRSDNKWYASGGEAYCTGNEGQCYVRFSKYSPYADYEVLDTDYENYSVVYSCFNLYIARWDLGWVLVRDPKVKIDNQVKLLGELTGIMEDQLHFTRQDECPPKDEVYDLEGKKYEY